MSSNDTIVHNYKAMECSNLDQKHDNIYEKVFSKGFEDGYNQAIKDVLMRLDNKNPFRG